jgi:N-acetylglucosaminyldiphosphoundecaprenol N-acetyl-beta-D-mannosaminyltransferase
MRRAELVVPDGAGIVWASDFLGCPLPGRVPGVALVDQLCSMAEKNGLRIYFLGGKPGIAEKAVEKMRQKYPQLPVAGFAHGYFKAESSEEEQIMRQIIEAKTDILLVALGVPGQEWFISRFRLTGHKCVAVGVGGSFDVISETLPRAPGWMQQFGIEWLFRLWLEPFRIGRIAKIPAFVLQVFRYKWNRE